ncbi:hypothetical protein HA45_09095 [Pantoea rodasii]|nr:hypothetical protein HA45_09095 [Pantoea rodasii]
MWCLYFPKVAEEHFQRAKALSMFVTGYEVDNPSSVSLPTNDMHSDASSVGEPAINDSHMEPSGLR